MEDQHRAAVALLDETAIAVAKRAIDRAIAILGADPMQRNPIQRLALHSAITKHVLETALTGERDEARLCNSALAIVLGAPSNR